MILYVFRAFFGSLSVAGSVTVPVACAYLPVPPAILSETGRVLVNDTVPLNVMVPPGKLVLPATVAFASLTNVIVALSVPTSAPAGFPS